jgi:hypothetical protein
MSSLFRLGHYSLGRECDVVFMTMIINYLSWATIRLDASVMLFL